MKFVREANGATVRAAPHRQEERSPYQFEAVVLLDAEGQTSRRRLGVVNLSNSGIMLKGETDIEIGTPVLIELNPDGKPFHVVGEVRHCTQTLGGYKIGVRLKFA
ncbi:MAG: PilZ domain-containing protein [Phycisphaerae bacterium]|nr:PilZ domain-containing protein [Phycisphaerae bacterium]